MKIMYQKNELKVKKTPNFKILLKVIFHSNKKSVFLTSFISLLMFVSVTTLVMTWHTNQYNCMINYFEGYDWNNDYQVSAYSANEGWDTFPENLLDDIMNSMRNDVNKIIPGIIPQKTSGLFSTVLNSDTSKIYEVCTSTDEIIDLMSEHINSGRMPLTYDEIVYLQMRNKTLFNLDDVISLYTSGLYPVSLNFTVVGIIEDADAILYQDGYSKDILRWEGLLDDTSHSFENEQIFEAMFFTSKPLYKEISLLDYLPVQAIVCDFNYDTTKIRLNGLKKYISSFDNIRDSWLYNYKNDEGLSRQTSLNSFWDLANKLEYFNIIMRKETLRIMIYFLPVLAIMIFSIIEAINFSKKSLLSSFWLMKIQGVEDDQLKEIIKLKAIYMNLVIGVLGIILSLLLGSVLKVALYPNISVGKYLSGLVNPLLLYIIVLAFSFVIITEYLLLRNYLNNTVDTQSDRYIVKSKKLLKKILTKEEVLISLLGLLLFSIGFTGLILLNEPMTIISDPLVNFQNFFTIFWTLFLTGIFCLSIAILLVLVKLVLFISQKIFEIVWKSRRNYLTLSLKSSNFNLNPLRNLLIILLIAGTILYPGMIFRKSHSEHIIVESNLALGCTDILVTNWNSNESLKKEIETLPNILCTAKVTKYHYEYFSLSILKSWNCELDILALHNLTEFNQVVDFSKINSEVLSDKINLLKEQHSFLVDKHFAKQYNNFEGIDIYSTDYWNPTNEILLEYIGSYDHFPLLTQMHTLPFEMFEPTFTMVMTDINAQLLVDINPSNFAPKGFLLIKTNSKNNAEIQKYLLDNYDLNTKVSSDTLNELNVFNTNFREYFLIILVILIAILLLLLGFISSSNTFQNNIQSIEASYRVGATKRQLFVSYSLELQMVILFPLLISVIGGFFLQKALSSFLYNSLITYKPIELWIPIWLIGVILSVEYVSLMLGWSLKFSYDLKSYQPIRQE